MDFSVFRLVEFFITPKRNLRAISIPLCFYQDFSLTNVFADVIICSLNYFSVFLIIIFIVFN